MTADEAQRTTLEKVRVLQRKLYRAAKAQPQRTFGVLFDKVCSLEVLWFAWAQVRRNRGAAGVDGETIESIEARGTLWFLLELREELMQQRYRPQPVRRVFIPKPDGRQRPLGIPGVKDRVAQAAVKIVIEPLFEASFRPGSYGFRPKRSAKQAIYDIRKWVTFGYDKVIDLDLKSYFDTIDHEILVKLVQRRVRDPRVLRLIRLWLKAGVLHEGILEETVVGSPQGAVMTPRTQKITSNLNVACDSGGNRVRIEVCRNRLYIYGRCREPAISRRPSASITHGPYFGKSSNSQMRPNAWRWIAPSRRAKPTVTSNRLSN